MLDEHIGAVPPHSIEAEQSTLGSMMLENDALHKGASILTAGDFYRPVHQVIFDALLAQIDSKEPCDLITLQEELRKRGKLEDCGGTEYLMALVESVPTAAHIEHYAKIVAKKSTFRKLIAAGMAVVGSAQAENDDAVSLMMNKAVEIGAHRGGRLRRSSEIMHTVFDRFTGYMDGRGAMGHRFGIWALDHMIYGMNPGELIIIGGRPSQGKSVLLQHALDQAAMSGKVPLLFTAEMTTEEVVERIVCMRARVDANTAKSGKMTGEDWDRIVKAHGELSNTNFLVDDMPCALTKLCARARSAVISDNVGIILIDYLQLIDCDIKTDNRDGQLSAVCWTLKNLAKELNVPVVVPSQLSRSIEKREDKTPLLSDLRDGGNQEGHADKVILIDNPLPKMWTPGDPLEARRARIVVAKNRGGKLGTIPVWFTPCWTRFDGEAPEDMDQ